jgi:hypothetical protein
MTHSEHFAELATALAKAAANFPPIERGCTAKVKTKSGHEYSYDYADLDDVLRAVRPHLAAEGLTLTHDNVVIREPLAVETTAMLLHSSGQFLKTSPLYIPCDGTMAPAQLVGSASTYGKRYTTQAILGLSTEADDDGNGAGGNDATSGARQPREKLPPCPKCGKTSTVIIGKPQFGGGLVCFKKMEGCGHTWEVPGHPLTKSQETGSAPEKPAEPAKSDKPEACKEFAMLSKFLRNCGCETPEQATAVINWAVAGVGQISDLRMMAGECKQIFNALESCGMTGPQILAEATQVAA